MNLRTSSGFVIALGLFASTATAEIQPSVKARMERERAERQELNAKLDEALTKNDDAAIAALLGPKLTLKGLWFPSKQCRKRFGGRVVATDEQANERAACLATVKLKINQYGYLEHEPGSSWNMMWRDGKLAALSNLEIDPASPTIHKEVLAKHAKKGLDVKRDAKTAALMKENPGQLVGVDLRVCVDEKGRVDALSVTAEPAFESYRATVEAAAKRWTFRPFKHAGKPIRVCAPYWVEQNDGDNTLRGVEGGVVGGGMGPSPGAEPPAPTPPPRIKR
jgi:hypothetical protein